LQIYFLVGMSRTGITWLSRALNQHPEIGVFGQSRFWGKHYLQPDPGGLYGEPQRDRLLRKIREFEWNATVGDRAGCFKGITLPDFRHLLSEAVQQLSFPASPGRVFAAMASEVARLKSARLVIEKTPHHVLHTQRILQALPNARFLLLWCDAGNHMRALKSQTDLLYHPAAAATVWRRYNAALNDLRVNLSDRSILIRYADLKARPIRELTRIVEWFGLQPIDWQSCLPEFYCGYNPVDSVSALSAADRFWLHRINGVRLDDVPANRVRDRLSVLRSWAELPIFAVRHLRRNLPGVEGSWIAYYRKWLRPEKESP
jgi:hypothetical protein